LNNIKDGEIGRDLYPQINEERRSRENSRSRLGGYEEDAKNSLKNQNRFDFENRETRISRGDDGFSSQSPFRRNEKSFGFRDERDNLGYRQRERDFYNR
jgi:hypothetical protein